MKPTSITALLLVCGIMAPPAGHAATISEAELGGWKDNRVSPAGDIPCNYLYLDYQSNFLYYGTSSQCRTRISQHWNAMVLTSHLLTQFEALTSVANWRAQLWTWSSQTNADKPYQDRGTSDSCLAINHYWARMDQKVWYLPITNRADAAKVEACVLQTAVGVCNRKGNGTTRRAGIPALISACTASGG